MQKVEMHKIAQNPVDADECLWYDNSVGAIFGSPSFCALLRNG